MKKIILSIIGIIAIIALALGIYIYPLAFSKCDDDTMIFIYPNMTNDQLADTLKSRLGNEFGDHTITTLNLLKSDITQRVGAYKIPKGSSPYHAARLLQRGAQTSIRFSFNYVRTVDQFAERVSQRLLMDKEDLLTLLTDAEFCKKYGKTPETIVSIFQPDTYDFFWTVSPKAFVDNMFRYYNLFWNEERLAKAKALGFTPDEVVTIGSIVEEEIAKREEAGKVARLYINRIQKGMLLQADPTVKFALGDFKLRRIWSSMLSIDSPYNTYRYKGLPPGPIRFVEKRTLDAVLNAPSHPYIYMCAKEDFSGYHNFTASYAEHKNNARRYQRELNRRGIKK
ncbi:MAG: endolytic transglycosylase MltG [Bacteroidales bacterium]|nr:endolytic transglycosylase MltG [Bacteroidales bacterium]